MTATPFDSVTMGGLFADPEVVQLFTDSAELRAMLVVEGALAKAQGTLGMIPSEAAEAIHRASLEVVVDPGALREATSVNVVPVPALVAAFRGAMADPNLAQYAHWGATSQDIVDTGLALRLRQVVARQEAALAEALAALADVAEAQAATPMAGRTWGLAATPTSFGAVVAGWGQGLLHAKDGLSTLREALLSVSLSGAAGTLSAMGGDGPEVRALLAEGLGLRDPGHSTHAMRAPIVEYAAWMARTLGSLAKMSEDVLSLVRSGEASLAGGGGSSTMPQKQNPVTPSVILALARHGAAQASAMTGAMAHRDQRDGAAWMTEWLVLPQLCIGATRALALAGEVARALSPNREVMARGIDPDGLGLIHAEALTFGLARHMPRPEAQAAVKAMCAESRENGVSLTVLAASRFPAVKVSLNDEATLGDAPLEAARFVRAVRQG